MNLHESLRSLKPWITRLCHSTQPQLTHHSPLPPPPPTEREGTAVLDALSNCGTRWTLRVTGDLIVNGCQVNPARLARRVAYVQEDCRFSPNMSVRQTMLFHAFLQEPGHAARGHNIKQKVGLERDMIGER